MSIFNRRMFMRGLTATLIFGQFASDMVWSGDETELSLSDKSNWLCELLNRLRSITKANVVLISEDLPPQPPRRRYRGQVKQILDAFAKDMKCGWNVINGVVVISDRLRPISIEEARHLRIQYARLIEYAALLKLLDVIPKESWRQLTHAHAVKFYNGTNEFDLIQTIALLCPSQKHFAPKPHYLSLRIYAFPEIAFYPESDRVPGFIWLQHPLVAGTWHKWSGDSDKSPLHPLCQLRLILGKEWAKMTTIPNMKIIPISEVISSIKRATKYDVQIDQRIASKLLMTTRSNWEMGNLLDLICRGMYARARLVSNLIFIYPRQYDGQVHRWLDKQMVRLLSPIFKEAIKHCGVAREFLQLGAPREVQVEPFTLKDFTEGRCYSWHQLSRAQRAWLRKVVPSQVWQWLNHKCGEEIVVQCLPGINFEIESYDENGQKLHMVTIPFK